MASRTSLPAFLARARSALTAPPPKRATPLTFVVGNESADLDSLCSALIFAYLRTHIPPHTLHIPISHLPRDDLTLRPEFTAVLNNAAASPDDVLTLSDLPGSNDLKPEDTRWLLLDHNVMTGKLGELYGSRVTGCIDHHVDEHQVPTNSHLRVIEKAGSCTSLVVEYCRDVWEGLSQHSTTDPAAAELDEQLAHLAIAPILIDTMNLTDKIKTTAHDTDAISYLERKILQKTKTAPGGAGRYERQAFYKHISRLKEDISPLSVRDVLRKDYKEWDVGQLKLGTSSIPQNMRFLVEKAGGEDTLAKELQKWADEKGLGIVALLTATRTDSAFTRELLLWGTNQAGVQAAMDFEKDCGSKLQFECWGYGKMDVSEEPQGWRRCWKQANVEHGRKQIAPMLREAMKGSLSN